MVIGLNRPKAWVNVVVLNKNEKKKSLRLTLPGLTRAWPEQPGRLTKLTSKRFKIKLGWIDELPGWPVRPSLITTHVIRMFLWTARKLEFGKDFWIRVSKRACNNGGHKLRGQYTQLHEQSSYRSQSKSYHSLFSQFVNSNTRQVQDSFRITKGQK
jgi:hypothetical protein